MPYLARVCANLANFTCVKRISDSLRLGWPALFWWVGSTLVDIWWRQMLMTEKYLRFVLCITGFGNIFNRVQRTRPDINLNLKKTSLFNNRSALLPFSASNQIRIIKKIQKYIHMFTAYYYHLKQLARKNTKEWQRIIRFNKLGQSREKHSK